MPAGHPSSYKPEYCEKIIEHMAQGYSFESFGAEANCHKDTLYEWRKVHPEFSEAVKIGRVKQAKWWENLGRAVAVGAKGKMPNGTEFDPKRSNATIFIWMTKNMLGWKDRIANEIDLTSSDNSMSPVSSITHIAKDPEVFDLLVKLDAKLTAHKSISE
jgi:hypothetical protein